MKFTIDNENSGKQVLSYLRSVLKISRSALAALKRDEKGIMVNGEHVTVRYVLKVGDLLEVNEKDSSDSVNELIFPINLPIDVLFENDDVILINKPPYMPTHPSHGHTDDTLANALAYKYKDVPFIFRPIGRLDRNTSGISLIAKHSISASYLFYARQKNMIKKKYLAVLCGKIDDNGDFHTIDTYMRRQEDSIIIRCIGSSEDKDSFRAITHWRLLYSNDNISIVEAIPETGRTHQLRVHFAHIGHPILGDDVYGTPSTYISRHALHAVYLSIPLPFNGELLETVAPVPQDMVYAIKQMANDDPLALKALNYNH